MVECVVVVFLHETERCKPGRWQSLGEYVFFDGGILKSGSGGGRKERAVCCWMKTLWNCYIISGNGCFCDNNQLKEKLVESLN